MNIVSRVPAASSIRKVASVIGNGARTLRKTVGRAGVAAVAATALLAVSGASSFAQSDKAKPIRIGFGIPKTGAIAANGLMNLAGIEIWRDDVNAAGGILGRPVELVIYDDQSQPSNVPGIYNRLFDVDNVDLAIVPNGTAQVAASIPIFMQRDLPMIGFFAAGANEKFKYDKYFSLHPAGEKIKQTLTQGYIDIALKMNPPAKTLAIVGADSEYALFVMDAMRQTAKAAGLSIVYDERYPPNTTDFMPVILGLKAKNPDVVFVASYPLDSVGMVRAAREGGLKTRLFGGGMVGLQLASIETQLGDLLNGVVNYDFWLPAKTLTTPEVDAFLKKYQTMAAGMKIDPLGYYSPPFSYSYMQVYEQAIRGTGGTDPVKIAEYLRANKFKTLVGELEFGASGERKEGSVFFTQFQGLSGNGLDQFRTSGGRVILYPENKKTGDLLTPFP